MKSSEITHEIVAGPDLMAIAISLFDSWQPRRPLEFSVKARGEPNKWPEHVFVNCLQRDDGSAKRWIIHGVTVTHNAKIEIFYDLYNRTGGLKFVK